MVLAVAKRCIIRPCGRKKIRVVINEDDAGAIFEGGAGGARRECAGPHGSASLLAIR